MNRIITLVFCVVEVTRTDAYNVDVSSYRVMKGPEDNSYFGYSLASAQINGSLTIWSGSPKLGPVNGSAGSGREGAIYHCEIVQTASKSLQQNCKQMNFRTKDQNRKKNGGEAGKEDGETTLAEELLPKCSFNNDVCTFTLEQPQFWKYRKDYTSNKMLKDKSSTRKTESNCYPHIKKRNRLTGPPNYSINEGILVLDSDRAIQNIRRNQSITTKLSTQIIKARSGKKQCLRFCFNAFSLLDLDLTAEVKSKDWYRPNRSTKKPVKSERSLRVYLQYDGATSTRELFLYQGPRDVADKNWNFTEVNINHQNDGRYKIYFEVTVVNKRKRKMCSVAADIALADISVTNADCHAEEDQIDYLDEEQAIGMTLDASFVDHDTSKITTCGPLWQQNCGFAKEASGVCYEVLSNSSQPKLVKNPGLKGCIRGKIDIVLLVDQSGSVNQCNFQKVKHWLRNVVRGFAIGPSEQDIGIVIYSSKEFTRDVFELGFARFGNSGEEKKRIMLESLLKLSYEAGKTYTGVAFKHANDMLWGPNARPDAKKMIILLTDGETSDPDKENLRVQTQISRTKNATILTVGVAKYNKSELISISGDENNFFSARDFSELEKIRDTLRFTVSHSNLEGSRSSKSMQNCLMGFSMHRRKNELLMGAPGCFLRAGDVMRSVSSANTNGLTVDEQIDENINKTEANDTTSSLAATGSNQTMSPLQESSAMDIEVPTFEDLERAMPGPLVESYLGYAVTSGDFFGRASGSYVASSAPRYNGRGAVLVYKSFPTNFISNSTLLQGIQFGEYFGAVLCAEDLNNDNFTDLFVGAPLHSDINSDEGRVYVYMGGKVLSSKPDVVWKGSGLPFSRFGLVISPVGDVTLDGYKDIVVSAPQEDNGKGAIYLFCGGEGKVAAEFTQRIAASALADNHNFKTFGQSISGLDVDGNKYPDLLVGTPGSDAIVVLRTRPVAYIKVQFDVVTPEIDRRNDLCWSRNVTSDDSCIRCKVCFSYNGESVPAGISLKYTISPDIFKSIPRAAFNRIVDQRQTIQDVQQLWNPNIPECSEYILHLKKNIPDMMTNLTMELTYDMEEYTSNQTKNSSSDLQPVLEAVSKKTYQATTFFKTYCEDTASCVADISVANSGPVSEDGSSIQNYTMSYERLLWFRLELYNAGPEEAHAVQVTVRYPSILVFNVIFHTECLKNMPQLEDASSVDGVNSVTFVLRNTFLGVKESCPGRLKFLVKSALSEIRPDSVTIYVNTSTLSRDYSLQNNVKAYKIPLQYQTSFTINGSADPASFSGYFTTNSTNSSQGDAWPFSHSYTIINIGPYPIENASVTVQWPACTMVQPHTQGEMYYAQYKKTIFWNGRLAETNQSNVVSVTNSILLGNDSVICYDSQDSGGSGIEGSSSNCFSSNVAICPEISIFVKKILPDRQINLQVFGEIDVSQFIDIEKPVSLLTDIEVKIPAYNLKYVDDQLFRGSLATTFFPSRAIDKFDNVKNFTDLPLWVYIVSILVGLLLLIAAMWLLRWCGFFESKWAKKKKDAEDNMPGDEEETAPMNPDA